MIANWFCCLPFKEHSVLLTLLQMFGNGQLYITHDQWALLWPPLVVPLALKRAENMVVWVGLVDGVAIIDDQPVAVYYFPLLRMTEILLFSLSPAGMCSDGCWIERFSRAH